MMPTRLLPLIGSLRITSKHAVLLAAIAAASVLAIALIVVVGGYGVDVESPSIKLRLYPPAPLELTRE
jgi:hypothetical protein